MSKIRKFILCVGGQKCGSTWLFNQLQKNKKIDLPPFQFKEPKVFFSRYKNNSVLKANLSQILLELNNPIYSNYETIKTNANINNNLKFLNMYFSNCEYLNFFSKFLKNSDNYTGDFSVDTALIDIDGLKKIASIFDQYKVDLKIIYIIRDPIERHFSAIRSRENYISQNPDYLKKKHYQRIFKTWKAEKYFLTSLNDKRYLQHGMYEKNIPKLIKAFGKKRVFIYAYEKMFSKEFENKISSFLNIEFKNLEFNKFVNQTPIKKSIKKEDLTIAKKTYHDTYKYCFDKFDKSLKYIWH